MSVLGNGELRLHTEGEQGFECKCAGKKRAEEKVVKGALHERPHLTL